MTIIIVSIAIVVIALAGMITDKGENTWETLYGIYQSNSTKKKELELQMMKEQTKQMVEQFKIKQLEEH